MSRQIDRILCPLCGERQLFVCRSGDWYRCPSECDFGGTVISGIYHQLESDRNWFALLEWQMPSRAVH